MTGCIAETRHTSQYSKDETSSCSVFQTTQIFSYMAQPSDQHSQEQGQPASEDPSHAKQHPNTVHHIRYQLRRLTEDILSHGRHPLADSSSGTGISENPNSQASNSGDNDSGNGPKSNGTPPQPVKPMPSGVSSDLIKPGGWDEMCLGLWVQDREMRRRGIPARCYGIAVARIYKVFLLYELP